MDFMNRVLSVVCLCLHNHITWPRTREDGTTYVRCLTCGRDINHNLLQPDKSKWRWEANVVVNQ